MRRDARAGGGHARDLRSGGLVGGQWQRAARAVVAAAAVVAGCAVGPPPPAPAPPGTRVLVFGERHDQRDHQRQAAEAVDRLAAAGRLQAVVLEMAEDGVDTRAVGPTSDDAAARAALAWREAAWPWAQYGPVVMAAVRAGVPVWGGNLPRAALPSTMADPSLDAAVPADVAARLDTAIADGHCGLLPEAMGPGMRRVQVARDRRLAAVVAARLAEGPGTVVLLTGAQHASRDRGVPWHLAHGGGVPGDAVRVVIFDAADGASVDGLVADERRPAATTPSPDRCEALRQRFAPPAPRPEPPAP